MGRHWTEVAFAILTERPWVHNPALPWFFQLLSSWTVDRTHLVLMQWILLKQLAVEAWAKYYKKECTLAELNGDPMFQESSVGPVWPIFWEPATPSWPFKEKPTSATDAWTKLSLQDTLLASKHQWVVGVKKGRPGSYKAHLIPIYCDTC